MPDPKGRGKGQEGKGPSKDGRIERPSALCELLREELAARSEARLVTYAPRRAGSVMSVRMASGTSSLEHMLVDLLECGRGWLMTGPSRWLQ